MSIRYFFSSRKARQLGVKCPSLHLIHKRKTVLIEQYASLGQTSVKAHGDLRIGAYSYIHSGQISYVSDIGRFCSIGQNVLLGQDPRNHPVDWATTSHEVCLRHNNTPQATTIGHDVWIGQGAIIMSGITIGTGAIVGANAIVTKDIEPYEIVAGNPAKVIKKRFDNETIDALLISKWWTKDLNQLQQLNYEQPVCFANQAKNLKQLAQYSKVSIKNRKVSKV